jgi:AcrR family transcriptional regulator
MRTALLDAAEKLMLEEGYAAVSARRVAAEVGANAALVYYYFANMDDLLIALFRRGADTSLEAQANVLSSPQPVWGLWDLTHHQTSTALTLEFIALANHRRSIRTEIADYMKKFREMQLATMSTVLEAYGLDPNTWPAGPIILSLWGISQYLLIEQAFELDIAHAETLALIEKHITALEGPRRTSPTRFAATG